MVDTTIFTQMSTLVRFEDQVICFDPSYALAVQLSGGELKHIARQSPTFKVDW